MKKTISYARNRLAVFRTDLGWMALVGSGGTVKRLTFGHASPKAAVAALPSELLDGAVREVWNQPLIRRLQAFASGARDDFRDVEVDLSPLTDFQRRVLQCCRQIPYGETLTYGQLAAKAGAARAARAIGNCMAANPVPLVIPCHRVVAANGKLGGYSAAGAVETKRRLLSLEISRSGGS
jgi:methylated-DNA-[protein]-cysteine S-methyltransferase